MRGSCITHLFHRRMHESPAVGLRISRLSGPVELTAYIPRQTSIVDIGGTSATVE